MGPVTKEMFQRDLLSDPESQIESDPDKKALKGASVASIYPIAYATC